MEEGSHQPAVAMVLADAAYPRVHIVGPVVAKRGDQTGARLRV